MLDKCDEAKVIAFLGNGIGLLVRLLNTAQYVFLKRQPLTPPHSFKVSSKYAKFIINFIVISL